MDLTATTQGTQATIAALLTAAADGALTYDQRDGIYRSTASTLDAATADLIGQMVAAHILTIVTPIYPTPYQIVKPSNDAGWAAVAEIENDAKYAQAAS